MERKFDTFIKSGLDEADFFGLPKDNTITIHEYLEEMHGVDFKFHKISYSEISSIKKKLNWVEDIDFYDTQCEDRDDQYLSYIYLHTNDGRTLSVTKYMDRRFDLDVRTPKFKLFNKIYAKDLERRKELIKVQEELEEIGKIGFQVYKGKLIPKESVSYNFMVHYRPEAGLYVFDNDSDLFFSLLKHGVKCYDRPIVKDTEKPKIYSKILIKK